MVDSDGLSKFATFTMNISWRRIMGLCSPGFCRGVLGIKQELKCGHLVNVAQKNDKRKFSYNGHLIVGSGVFVHLNTKFAVC